MNGQEPFNTGSTIAFPLTGFNSLTWWIDVEVTPVATGVYSIFQQGAPAGVTYASPGGTGSTFGTFFTLSRSASLTGIWVYSGASDATLPTACGIFDVATQAIVPGTLNTSPSWSGALGSGWVKCPFGGAVTLDNRIDGYAVAALFTGGKRDTTSPLFP